MKRLVIVYRSPKVAEMYLYVNLAEQLERVPEVLLARFGEPVEVMRLALAPERALARVETAAVLEALAGQGFYLQLPPPVESPAEG